MEIQPDYKELLKLLNAHEVEYVIVGAHALAFHGAPRFTGDIDILLHPSQKNAARVLSALSEFGFVSLGLVAEDFAHPDRIIQLGVQPVRIDLITSIDGVTWEQAWQSREPGDYDGVTIFFLGKEQFIANKRAVGRKKDLADLEELGEE